MRVSAAAVCLLLASPLTIHAVKPPTKKPATKIVALSQVVRMAVKKGVDWTLDDYRAVNLGYGKSPVTKEYVLDGETSPTQHAIMVTFQQDNKTPQDVMISSTTATEFSGEQPSAIDGYTFRSDLNGRLIAGIHARGKVESVAQEKLDTSLPETKRRFDVIMAAVRAHPAVKGAEK